MFQNNRHGMVQLFVISLLKAFVLAFFKMSYPSGFQTFRTIACPTSPQSETMSAILKLADSCITFVMSYIIWQPNNEKTTKINDKKGGVHTLFFFICSPTAEEAKYYQNNIWTF